MRLHTVEPPAAAAHCLSRSSFLNLLHAPAPSAEATALPGGIVAQRYAEELSLLAAMPGLRPPAAALLAGRAAGSFLEVQPAAIRSAEAAARLAQTCLKLAGACPSDDALRLVWSELQGADGAPDTQSLEQVRRLWPLAAAAESLLAQGGDERLTLDPATGLNRYGCAPCPRPDVIAFGSCTASSISAAGLLAAESLRRRLLSAALEESVELALEQASQATAACLLEHFGASGIAEAMLVASGTDAALLITALIAASRPCQPMTSILMSPSETGSGVPQAVQGRHFSSVAASGETVPKDSGLSGIPGEPALLTIALRDELGRPRPAADVAADCEAAVGEAAARGHVVLHAIDGSKTGLTAPGRAACRHLRAAFGDRLSIVIDACQVRIEPALVRGYLADGFCVLITGSKFFAAPGFCGAILAPLQGAGRLARGAPLPAGLHPYATSAGGLVARRCPGLLLRWAAALRSMQAFAAVPPEVVRSNIDRLGTSVRSMLMREPRVLLIEAPRPMAMPEAAGAGWSHRGSVISFAVRSVDGGWLSAEALRPLYLALAADSSGRIAKPTEEERRLASALCQIGQPVALGSPRLGALRIAFSADQIAAGGRQDEALRTLLAKLGLLLNHAAP